ncbi:MAG: tetratricopeptide repeat protein [Ferruginibacter sp.]
MRSFLMIALTCMSTCCLAQQKQLDSTLNELVKHPEEDTVRMALLYDIAWYYKELDPVKGLSYADELIRLAKKLRHKKLEAKGYFSKGINYWAMGQYYEALGLYKTAREVSEKAGAMKFVANINNSMAAVYQSISDYPNALDIYWTNLRLFEKLEDTLMVAITYGNLGMVYRKIRQFDKAIEYLLKAIAKNKAAGKMELLANNYNSIGNAYDDAGNSSKAIEFYQKNLAISLQSGNTLNIANAYCNMGISYTTLANYGAAYKFLLLALPEYRKSKNKQNEAIALNSIGDIFLQAPDSFFSNNHIAGSQKYLIAEHYFDSSLKMYIALEDPAAQASILESLSDLYEKTGNYKKSLEAHKKYAILKDSIFSDETKEQVFGMEIKYAAKKREDSITVEHNKKELIAALEIRRRTTIQNAITTGGAIFFAAAIVSFIFYKKRRDAKQKQQEAEFQTEVTDTEMKALRAQMNPHFIFNSLNSISDYITKYDTASADKYLSKFAKLMRMILENSEQKEVSLSEDLKALELYMQLEALRMKNKFSYAINIDQSINAETTMVPPLILQPFVENSIWHGIAQKEGPGKISICIKNEDGSMINCIVEDDGIGRQQSTSIKTNTAREQNSSLGMKITQSRIDILNKLKNTKAAVNLIDLAQGMRVEVRLPLATNF